MENIKTYINEGIKEYVENPKMPKYPWHMPGHKRKEGLKTLTSMATHDFTEVLGLDDYHNPKGIIRESVEQLSRIYNTDYSNYIVNGTTAGNLAAIFATCKRGDKILVARNCHKSVYNAINLLELDPVYIFPHTIKESDISMGITVEDIALLDCNNQYKACIITSPTYEGIVSDIYNISEYLHDKGVPLIVDEAHGAHFPFASWLPKSAVALGADIVVQSLHKTMPCINQCSIIHVSNKMDVDLSNRVNRYLGIFQTSSPSYLMLANMEEAICWAISKSGQEAFDRYYADLLDFRKKAESLVNIELLEEKNQDISRLVFLIKHSEDYCNLSGRDIYELLEVKFGMVLEMTGNNYVVAISTVFDERDDFGRLYEGLCFCDEVVGNSLRKDNSPKLNSESTLNYSRSYNSQVLDVVINNEKKTVTIEELINLVADSKNVYATTKHYIYPPGIPIINEGEEFTGDIIEKLDRLLKDGRNVKGIY